MADVSETCADRPPIELDAARIRQRFASAFRPRPLLYWADMGISALIGWSAFVLALGRPIGSMAHLGYTLLAIFALLRGALFIHELAHVRRGALPGFEVAWHALVGVPLMLPSLMYVGSHADHHRRNAFGTTADPEYAPIARWSRLRIARFVLGVALVPLILPIRWGVLAPLSHLFPPLRRLVVERASTLVINPSYRRPMPKGNQARRWVKQEAATGAFFWLVAAGVLLGWIPTLWIVQWYFVAAGILVVNQVRTLAAHGYENEGEQVDTVGQLLDSINLRGIPVLTALVAPVGLRYHALHHFLPAVPYHSLGTLHRRLLAELPSEAPYHRTERPGLLPTLRDLWKQSPA
jgi:fatty acid desaturase